MPSSSRVTVIRRTLLSAGLLLLVAAGLVLPFPMNGRLWGALFDLAHAPTFCFSLLALVAFLDPAAIGLSDRYTRLVRMNSFRVLLCTVTLMVLGLAGEYLQQYAGRNPSVADVIANSAGLLSGMAWIESRKHSGKRRSVFAVTALVVLLLVSLNPLQELNACLTQICNFPMLASFEDRRETGSWRQQHAIIEPSAEWSADGQQSLKVRLLSGEYPEIAMEWFEKDWSDYNTLHIAFNNRESRPLELTLKVFDTQHVHNDFPSEDRFHQNISLAPLTSTTIAISLEDVRTAPADRAMDMHTICGLEIFCTRSQPQATFFIDNVHLTK